MTEPIMQFFAFTHLPPFLQEVSAPFSGLAWLVHDTLPRSPERSAALRKLLEAKDAAVRARLFKEAPLGGLPGEDLAIGAAFGWPLFVSGPGGEFVDPRRGRT